MPPLKWIPKFISRGNPSLQTQSLKPAKDPVDNDWLDNAVQAAKYIAAAGELAPFPFIKGSASLFLTLIEPVQVCPWNTP